MCREPQQVQQEGYWRPSEEFYPRPMQPPSPPPQQSQQNSGLSMDYDKILQTLTSLTQGLQDQAKEMTDVKNQIGQIAEFMGQFREQGKLPSSTIVNPKGGFETAKAITLRSCKEVGTTPNQPKQVKKRMKSCCSKKKK